MNRAPLVIKHHCQVTIPLGIYFTTAYVVSLKCMNLQCTRFKIADLSIVYVDAPSPLALPGCYLAGSNFLAAGDFVLVVFAEIGASLTLATVLIFRLLIVLSVIVTLTLIKGIQHGGQCSHSAR